MLTTNVIHRVFFLKAGEGTGTVFAIDEGGKQYLVTAAHVVEGLSAPYNVSIFHQGQWKDLPLQLTGISSVADVAVFSAGVQLAPSYSLPATTNGVIYGQDVHFLGFPYGIVSDIGTLNRGFPFPLVKAACLSAFIKDDNGASIILLDGHNNPGFSGGPVVFHEHGQPLSSGLRVMSVVSGYRFAHEPVFLGDAESPAVVRANTGIVITYDIKHAIELIQQNPNGVPIVAS